MKDRCSYLPKLILLAFITLLTQMAMADSFSKYVGQAFTLPVPKAPQGTVTSWAYEESDNTVVTNRGTSTPSEAVIIKYFTGSEIIQCNFRYAFIGVDGKQYTADSYEIHRITCIDNKISISAPRNSMKIGESMKISYKFEHIYYDATPKVTWETSNSNAFVDYNGNVTAKKSGRVKIYAKSNLGSNTASCEIDIEAVEPTSIKIPAYKTMTVGETLTLTPEITPINAETTLTWRSDDTSVATVSQTGEVYAKKHGNTTITVTTSNGLSSECKLTVNKAKLSLSVSPISGLYPLGTKVYLSSESLADIYYTTDGKTPTSSSNLYKQPIILDKNLKLKAIAMHPDYISSDVLECNYEITSLQMESTGPESSANEPASPLHLPYVKFNAQIQPDSDIHRTKVEANGKTIYPETLVRDNCLFIALSDYMPNAKISVTVPARAIKSIGNEYNQETKFEVIYGGLSIERVKEYGNKYRLMENGDLYMWCSSPFTPFPFSSITAPNDCTPVLVANNIKALYTGMRGYMVDNNDVLWGWGDNINNHTTEVNPHYYILGDGTKEPREDAVMIEDEVKKICIGWHNGLLKNDGTLWMWGSNTSGQIGDGTKGNSAYKLSPVKVNLNSAVKDFGLGTWHTVACLEDGSVWVWGNGEDIGSPNDIATPTKILSASYKIIKVATGSIHNIALAENGNVYCFGRNDSGATGIGETEGYTKPWLVLKNAKDVFGFGRGSVALCNDGTLYRWGKFGNRNGYDYSSPTKIANKVKRVKVCGNIVIQKEDNSLWGSGSNYVGQLGQGNTYDSYSDFVKIFDEVVDFWVTGDEIYALKPDGSIWGCGNNIGTGKYRDFNISTPTLIYDMHQVDVSELSLDSDFELEVGQKGVLSFEITPLLPTIQSVMWESSDVSVASVSNTGVICGVSPGTAKITLKIEDYNTIHEKNCLVTVLKAGASIYNIASDADDSTLVEIFNLNGVKIYCGERHCIPDLTPGVYIEKSLNHVTRKIIIR